MRGSVRLDSGKCLALVLIAACSRTPIATCADDLHGTWQGSGMRWVLLDNGTALEGYPLDPDVPEGSDRDLVAAPRALDLTRAVHGLSGNFVRRYERRAGNCEARSAVHIESCHDDTLELVTSELPAPINVAPCRWPVAALTHLERWRRLN